MNEPLPWPGFPESYLDAALMKFYYYYCTNRLRSEQEPMTQLHESNSTSSAETVRGRARRVEAREEREHTRCGYDTKEGKELYQYHSARKLNRDTRQT